MNAKQKAIRALARFPLYGALPPGALRTCGALLYHSERGSSERVTQLTAGMDTLPTRYLTPAVVASRAALRAGRDEVLQNTLTELTEKYPDSPRPFLLQADLHHFYGRFTEALRHAEHAKLLQPSSSAATARMVRYSYHALTREEADRRAAAAVRRFPRSGEPLWAACKACDSPEQYHRLKAAWEAARREPTDLQYAVRPLASAASRAGLVDEAVTLYASAIEQIRGGAAPGKVNETQLGGRGAWSAILDLASVLDAAKVPYFFAAGTALGLVREGRPLSADSDIDIGIFEADWDRAAVIDIFTHDPRFELDLHPLTKRVTVRHRGGSPIDLFRFYEEGGQIWHDGVFVRWRNDPFTVERRTVGGVELPLPAEPDKYLTECYADWRVPNPAFDAFTDDAPNVEITWPEYQRLHFLRRAYKHFASGDTARGDAELARAGDDAVKAG